MMNKLMWYITFLCENIRTSQCRFKNPKMDSTNVNLHDEIIEIDGHEQGSNKKSESLKVSFDCKQRSTIDLI